MVAGRFGKIIVIASAVWLSGCAARQVVPVRMAQPGDDDLACPELNRQIAANRAEAEQFLQKDKKVEAANTAKTVGTAIPVVGLLLIGSQNFSNEEQIKARALIDRDERLTYLAKKKGCT